MFSTSILACSHFHRFSLLFHLFCLLHFRFCLVFILLSFSGSFLLTESQFQFLRVFVFANKNHADSSRYGGFWTTPPPRAPQSPAAAPSPISVVFVICFYVDLAGPGSPGRQRWRSYMNAGPGLQQSCKAFTYERRHR